jgi:hypothetical protein
MTSKDFHRVENYRLEWMFETEKVGLTYLLTIEYRKGKARRALFVMLGKHSNSY